MEQILEQSNAGEFPVETAQVPQTETTPVTADPVFGNKSIAEQGMPQGQTFPIGDVTQPQAQEAEPQQESVEQGEIKDDPRRHEYWQSQADKVKNELRGVQDELDYYKNTLAPVEQVIKANPKVLDNLESLSNGQTQGLNPQQGNPQETSLQKPLRPEKPHSYNEVDAYNDPNSESFKYRMSLDKHRDDMIDWYGNIDQARQMQQQQAMHYQQQQMLHNNTRNNAIASWGYTETDADGFVQWASNPSNISMNNLKALYEMQKNGNQQQIESQQKVVQMQQQQERLKVPMTSAVQKGQAPAPMTDDQAFSASLFSNAKRR